MHIIAGLYRNRRLITPKGSQTRPTASRVREALFNICQNYIEDTLFLDLFAGSGAMGFEALSRGAKHVTFVEKNKEAIHCIQQNIKQLQVEEQTQILQGDVFQVLQKLQNLHQQFDIIYADPPYQTLFTHHESLYYSEKIIQWIDQNRLLTPKGMLFIEEMAGLSLHLQSLKNLILISQRRMGTTILQQFQIQLSCI